MYHIKICYYLLCASNKNTSNILYKCLTMYYITDNVFIRFFSYLLSSLNTHKNGMWKVSCKIGRDVPQKY